VFHCRFAIFLGRNNVARKYVLVIPGIIPFWIHSFPAITRRHFPISYPVGFVYVCDQAIGLVGNVCVTMGSYQYYHYIKKIKQLLMLEYCLYPIHSLDVLTVAWHYQPTRFDRSNKEFHAVVDHSAPGKVSSLAMMLCGILKCRNSHPIRPSDWNVVP
jgi:hypothetical protein